MRANVEGRGGYRLKDHRLVKHIGVQHLGVQHRSETLDVKIHQSGGPRLKGVFRHFFYASGETNSTELRRIYSFRNARR